MRPFRKCVHFRKGRKAQSGVTFSIGTNVLETVENYKYLGVTFNRNGNFNIHTETLAKGAGRALGKVISKIHNLKDFGLQSYEKLYYSCVTPILDYASAIWGGRKFQCIDTIHNRAIRYYLGVHRFAPVLAIYGDIGWIPSQYRHWVNKIRYWNRLLLFDDDRITKCAFNMDYSRCTNNWCSDIKDIFTELDLLHFYENKSIVDIKTVEKAVRDYYSRIWYDSVRTVPKLRTYANFKRNFDQEHYLKLNLSKNERSMLTQFRVGILPIRLETGRYVGESIEDRICKLCNHETVESEYHFLMNCPRYDDLRSNIFQDILDENEFCSLGENDKLKFLLDNFPRKTAKYIVAAFTRRKQTFYT